VQEFASAFAAKHGVEAKPRIENNKQLAHARGRCRLGTPAPGPINPTGEQRHEQSYCRGSHGITRDRGALRDLIDNRDWEGLALVFTADAVFDATDLGMPLLNGLDAIRKYMDESFDHPLGHHITNIYVESAGGEIFLRRRIIAAGHRGRVGSASYRDRVIKTPSGWRIQHRLVTLRRSWRTRKSGDRQ
jgi:SnoaL-like domain